MNSRRWLVAVGLACVTAAVVALSRTTARAQTNGAAVAVEAESPVLNTALPAGVPEPSAEPVGGAGRRADEAIRIVRAPGAGLTQTATNLINVTVENETLENVVGMFIKMPGVNIVATSANLDGLVTVNLKDVEWKPALAAILEVHNLALVEKMPGTAVYSIVPKPPDKTEQLVVETIFLNYTTVAEVRPVMATMLCVASNAMVTDFPSRNALVVKTTEANLREIRSLIEAVDRPGKQVCVEAKFMELTDTASKTLGIDWQMLDSTETRPGLTLGASGLSGMYTRQVSQNSVGGEVRYGNQIQGWNQLRDLDGEEITPTTPGSANQQQISQSDNQVYAYGQNAGNFNPQTGQFTPLGSASSWSIPAAILSASDLNVVMNAMKNTAGISLISNPKIIVASGSTNAFFKVGDREPLISVTLDQTATAAGSAQTLTAALSTEVNTDVIKNGFLETGISLQVVPVVKTDAMIEALILPRLVRNLHNDKTVALGGYANAWPRISVKEICTKFTLQSGQTVAIGGLTDTEDSKSVTKIPLLGDIPLIGRYLFSHTRDVKNQMETVVLVTLSLADPTSLQSDAGMPAGARLAPRKIIQTGTEEKEFEKDLQKIKAAAVAAESSGAAVPDPQE